MALVHVYAVLQKRAPNQGVTYTVVFIVVVVIVLTGIVFWALLPNIRQCYSRLRRTRTGFDHRPFGLQDDSAITLTEPVTSYRLVDLVNRGRYNNQSILPMYDPRFHTPFPRSPQSYTSVLERSVPINDTARSHAATGTGQRSLYPSTCDELFEHPVTRPASPSCEMESRGEHGQTKTPVLSKDFGDAKEFILTVPEPLSLRSRRLRTDPTPSNSLPSMADTQASSVGSERTIHPKKLFEQLGMPNDKNIVHKDATPGPQELLGGATEDRIVEPARRNAPHISDTSSQYEDLTTDHESGYKAATTRASSSDDDDETSPRNPSITAMHRLMTYRSLVGAPPPAPLTRAGTLSRPKTPVAKIRDLYDRSASDSKAVTAASRNNTVSTKIGTVADSSDKNSSGSSATSPPKTAPSKFAASSMSLLPIPLQIVRSPDHRSISSPTRGGPGFEHKSSKLRSPAAPLNATAYRHREKENKKPEQKTSNLPRLVRRPRPAPLKLATSTFSRIRQNARTPAGASIIPSTRSTDNSAAASSTYSRDTKGISVGREPAIHSHVPLLSPFTQSTTDGTAPSHTGTSTNLLPQPDPSVDNPQAKVDNWHLDMFNTSPSPSLKHALSHLGPESAGDSNHHRASAISTDLAPSESSIIQRDPVTSALHASASSLTLADPEATPPRPRSWSDSYLAEFGFTRWF